MATGRKTGGRQKGTPNRRTVAREATLADMRDQVAQALGMEAFDGDAHALLIAIYSNTLLPLESRIDAAKAAIPYEKPRLAAVTLQGDSNSPVQVVSRIELVPVEPKK